MPSLINQLNLAAIQLEDLTEVINLLIELHGLLEGPEELAAIRNKIDDLAGLVVENVEFYKCRECYKQLINFYEKLNSDKAYQLIEAVYRQNTSVVTPFGKYNLARYLNSKGKVKETIDILQEALDDLRKLENTSQLIRPFLGITSTKEEEKELKQQVIRLLLEIYSKDPEYYGIFFNTLREHIYFLSRDTKELYFIAYNILSSLEKEGKYTDIVKYSRGLARLLGTDEVARIVVRTAIASYKSIKEVYEYYSIVKDNPEIRVSSTIHTIKRGEDIYIDDLKYVWKAIAYNEVRVSKEDIVYLAYPLAKICLNSVLLISNKAKKLADNLPKLEGFGNLGKLLNLFLKSILVVNNINSLNWAAAAKTQDEIERELKEISEDANLELLELLKILVEYNSYLLSNKLFVRDVEGNKDLVELVKSYVNKLEVTVLGLLKASLYEDEEWRKLVSIYNKLLNTAKEVLEIRHNQSAKDIVENVNKKVSFIEETLNEFTALEPVLVAPFRFSSYVISNLISPIYAKIKNLPKLESLENAFWFADDEEEFLKLKLAKKDWPEVIKKIVLEKVKTFINYERAISIFYSLLNALESFKVYLEGEISKGIEEIHGYETRKITYRIMDINETLTQFKIIFDMGVVKSKIHTLRFENPQLYDYLYSFIEETYGDFSKKVQMVPELKRIQKYGNSLIRYVEEEIPSFISNLNNLITYRNAEYFYAKFNDFFLALSEIASYIYIDLNKESSLLYNIVNNLMTIEVSDKVSFNPLVNPGEALNVLFNWRNSFTNMLNHFRALTRIIKNPKKLNKDYDNLNLIINPSEDYSKVNEVLNNYPIAIAYLNPAEVIEHLDELDEIPKHLVRVKEVLELRYACKGRSPEKDDFEYLVKTIKFYDDQVIKTPPDITPYNIYFSAGIKWLNETIYQALTSIFPKNYYTYNTILENFLISLKDPALRLISGFLSGVIKMVSGKILTASNIMSKLLEDEDISNLNDGVSNLVKILTRLRLFYIKLLTTEASAEDVIKNLESELNLVEEDISTTYVSASCYKEDVDDLRNYLKGNLHVIWADFLGNKLGQTFKALEHYSKAMELYSLISSHFTLHENVKENFRYLKNNMSKLFSEVFPTYAMLYEQKKGPYYFRIDYTF